VYRLDFTAELQVGWRFQGSTYDHHHQTSCWRWLTEERRSHCASGAHALNDAAHHATGLNAREVGRGEHCFNEPACPDGERRAKAASR
jgi:hypothetical protein